MTISSLSVFSVLTALVLCGALGFDQAVPGIVFSEAVAQDKPKKDTRETRRTPALRNKVYERLAEAQASQKPRTTRAPKHPQRHDFRRR